MKLSDENRKKIGSFLGGTVFALVLAAVVIWVVGVNYDDINGDINNDSNTDNQKVIASYYKKATKEFERGDIREMQMSLGELKQKFPDENIQVFIDEKLSSIPTVNAFDLIEEYKTNSVSTNLKYEDKLLKVAGKVTGIGQDILKTVYITLGQDKETFYTFYDVRCEFEYEEEISQVANLREGDRVIILGTYSDFASASPGLEKCYILEN